MTKEKFDELELKARDKKFKKRSKIIKEVNEANEQAILDKILQKNNIKNDTIRCDYEESKMNSQTNSMIKVSIWSTNYIAIPRQES